jgi:hypothetical protein
MARQQRGNPIYCIAQQEMLHMGLVLRKTLGFLLIIDILNAVGATAHLLSITSPNIVLIGPRINSLCYFPLRDLVKKSIARRGEQSCPRSSRKGGTQHVSPRKQIARNSVLRK